MNPLPVTFYLDADDKSIASWQALCPDAAPSRLVLGEDYWIALSWMRLRAAGVDVALSNRVPDQGVVVFYAGDKRALWPAVQRDSRALLVAVRSDRQPVGFADVEIVQNAASSDGKRCFHLPHWPQPGLVARDAARGTALRTLLFPGTPQNLDEGFRSPRWHDFLASRGIGFRCHEKTPGAVQPVWNDLHDVDAFLAIRPEALGLIGNKPAWKLFNAWIAGVPAILGPESGYRELRESALDFIEAANVEQAMAAIARLCDAPGLYAAMVENGLRRGAEFGTQATVARWKALIDDVLLPRALAQQTGSGLRLRRCGRELHARLNRALK